uniref:NACHT domain-containing protein n=1 Tax=Terrapene triunguis TaxID=2587831 RepID=A0A674IVW3_9SAUR
EPGLLGSLPSSEATAGCHGGGVDRERLGTAQLWGPDLGPSPKQQGHLSLVQQVRSQLCTNACDARSCGLLEIRYTPLLLLDYPGPTAPPGHEHLALAAHRARLLPLHAPRRLPLRHLLAPLPTETQAPRRVALSGAAGIGKSVTVQKILHDWALGAAFQGPLCALDFSCRELSMMSSPVTLEGLICAKRPHLQEVLPELLARPGDLLVLVDGLDEFRHPLDGGTPRHRPGHPAHVKELLRGLIDGTLLPGAAVVVTSRPCPALSVDPVALLPCSLCGNCLGSEGARRLWEALRENRTLEELYLDITGITDSGLDNLVPCLLANSTLRLLT